MSVGRGVTCKKLTVDCALQFDMDRFRRDVNPDCASTGYTEWKDSGAKIGWDVNPPCRLRLYYTVTKRDGQQTNHDYLVDLDYTRLYFGGKRWWFFCPNQDCRRRCRILYMAPGSDYFLCRVCQNLTYRSQQAGPDPFKKLLRKYYAEALSKMLRGGRR